MLRKLRERMESEKGFTLIELLVVILIIGILAAIALPAFLGQRAKGQDGEAKSNARNLVSHMESCFTQNQTYAGCTDVHRRHRQRHRTSAALTAMSGDHRYARTATPSLATRSPATTSRYTKRWQRTAQLAPPADTAAAQQAAALVAPGS